MIGLGWFYGKISKVDVGEFIKVLSVFDEMMAEIRNI